MGCLIIVIITGVLCVTNVISHYACMGIIVASAAWMFIGASLYFKLGFCKFYYHDFLGWHTPDDSPQHSDGCSQHAKCKYCGKDIMQDSQGNWF